MAKVCLLQKKEAIKRHCTKSSVKPVTAVVPPAKRHCAKSSVKPVTAVVIGKCTRNFIVHYISPVHTAAKARGPLHFVYILVILLFRTLIQTNNLTHAHYHPYIEYQAEFSTFRSIREIRPGDEFSTFRSIRENSVWGRIFYLPLH